MRTRDAVRSEQLAAHLAIEAGTDCCPTAPLSAYRDGWKDQPLAVDYGTTKEHEAAIRRWQVGALARLIWEGLPAKERWWLNGGRRPR